MITPDQAEQVTQRLIEGYINAAKPRDMDDVAGLLLKLISMAGLALAATHDKDDAVQALNLAAEHLAKEAHRSRAEVIRCH